jgi:hypothetical protein
MFVSSDLSRRCRIAGAEPGLPGRLAGCGTPWLSGRLPAVACNGGGIVRECLVGGPHKLVNSVIRLESPRVNSEGDLQVRDLGLAL